MRLLLIIALLMSSLAASGQSLPDKPKPSSKKMVVLVNAVNFGSSAFLARSTWYGAHQCIVREQDFHANPAAKMRHSLEITLPIDAAIALLSWKLQKKHPSIALWLPSVSAAGQFGVGGMQYSAGCF